MGVLGIHLSEEDEVSRRIKQLEIEREAIKRENDTEKLAQLNKEIADLKEEETKQKAQWKSEKEQINKIQQNKIDIESLKFEADKAEREGDYGKVAEIRYGKIKQKEAEIATLQDRLKTMQGAAAMIKEEVEQLLPLALHHLADRDTCPTRFVTARSSRRKRRSPPCRIG